MNQADKANAIAIVNAGILKIVNNYSESALLINACYVAVEKYESLAPERILSTTAMIPEPLRLPIDLDVQYSFGELVVKYPSDVLDIVLRNYLIVSVSIVDAILEDLYEHFLKVLNPAITDRDLEKTVRLAWTNDSLLNFLTAPDKVNLQKPAHLETPVLEALMRYNELRIVRNTLLHTSGRLSDKNYNTLQANLVNTPEERKHFALAHSPLFNANREVVLTINSILSIRVYLHTFLNYCLLHSVN